MPGRIEVAIAAVLVRDHGRLAWPRDGESRVVPADAALAFRCIELVDEVERLGIVGQREKAVGEALGHVHHPAVLGRQLGTEALAEGRRALPQVEDRVVERPADAADDLGLGLGGKLVVHAAQRSLAGH